MQFWLRPREGNDRVGEMQGTERLRRREPQGPGRLGRRLDQRALLPLDIAEQLLAECKIGTTLIGQVERSRRPLQETHAEALFQHADMTRHERPRQIELVRRDREASGAGHPHECLHRAQAVHRDCLLQRNNAVCIYRLL